MQENYNKILELFKEISKDIIEFKTRFNPQIMYTVISSEIHFQFSKFYYKIGCYYDNDYIYKAQ